MHARASEQQVGHELKCGRGYKWPAEDGTARCHLIP